MGKALGGTDVWTRVLNMPISWLTAVHDVASGAPANIRGCLQNTSSALSSGAVCFEWVDSKIANGSMSFSHCVSPCRRFLTPEDSPELCVICLGLEHTHAAFEGAGCTHCDEFIVRKLWSCLSLFSRGEGQSPAPRGSGPAVAEAVQQLHLWGS